MESKNKQQDPDLDAPQEAGDFLVGEETENVKPTGVDDKSTGMGEGDSDYLGKTNRDDKEE
ncbi:hypothetical protein [Spirosoma sp.]|uniref:hypothetical protein n=1 Tax=Spirosoma sp. TaxID=1899569 RepID=UPI003B3A523E